MLHVYAFVTLFHLMALADPPGRSRMATLAVEVRLAHEAALGRQAAVARRRSGRARHSRVKKSLPAVSYPSPAQKIDR